MPVEFFKTHKISSNQLPGQIVFSSSSTSGKGESLHYVADLNIYQKSFEKAFELFYGDIKEYCFIALLPSYLERQGSSLIMMCDELIKKSAHPLSGFYLNEYDKLAEVLNQLKEKKQKTILLGVTFALLDFAAKYPIDLPGLIIMETGGMKGRGKELTRNEMHKILRGSFGVNAIHSEYGMTELLSQAYAKADGIFECPSWMKIIISDINDPFRIRQTGQSGIINIIDLANIYSCCFIQTSDIGKLRDEGRFEVLGRLDNSDLRGCSLLAL